jgi:hypothetical protein
MPVRPVLTEATDAAVDDARVDRLHIFVRHFQPVLHLGPHVLQDHVRGFRQPHERRMTLWRLQIQRDRPFVAVQVLKVEALAAARDIFALAGRRLDADHIRAPVREVPNRRGPGARQRQVQHRDAVQRQARLGQHSLVHWAFRHRSNLQRPADCPPHWLITQEQRLDGPVHPAPGSA